MSTGEFSIPYGYKLIAPEELDRLNREFKQWSRKMATFLQGWGETGCRSEDFYSGYSGQKTFYKRKMKYLGILHTLRHFIEIRCQNAMIGKTQTQCLLEIMHPVKSGKLVCLVGEHPIGCCPFKSGWTLRARLRFETPNGRSK